MKLSKGDRFLLILIALILGSFALYSATKSMSNAPGDSAAGLPDTLAAAASLVTDTLALKPEAADSLQPALKPVQKGKGLLTTKRYPGPPKWMNSGPAVRKLSRGEVLELNTADTVALQQVPGIGPSFARRIYSYRELLGGYYAIEQLQEVYGMERERYDRIAPYFVLQKEPSKIFLSPDSISRHPYLSFRQMDVL